MKYKGTLVTVGDCQRALLFYRDMFNLELIQDNDGNMELSNGIDLQGEKYWEQFIQRKVIHHNHSTELYFKEENMKDFVHKLKEKYSDTVFVNELMTHSWGQQVVRFCDPDRNLVEVGTPV